jgi:hypothetical protein
MRGPTTPSEQRDFSPNTRAIKLTIRRSGDIAPVKKGGLKFLYVFVGATR